MSKGSDTLAFAIIGVGLLALVIGAISSVRSAAANGLGNG